MQTSGNLAEERLSVCRNCPLFKDNKTYGPVCNKNKWINAEGLVSTFPKPGYTRGCGCRLRLAVKQVDHHCPINRW